MPLDAPSPRSVRNLVFIILPAAAAAWTAIAIVAALYLGWRP